MTAGRILLSVTPRGRKSFVPIELQTNQDVAGLLADVLMRGADQTLRRDGDDRDAARAATADPLHSAPAPARRHGLGGEPARRDLQRRIWLERSHQFTRPKSSPPSCASTDRSVSAARIAERAGETIGCVFLVGDPDNPSQTRLRLLLVEAEARGLGIGARLVDECVRLARGGALPQDHAVDAQYPDSRPRDLPARRVQAHCHQGAQRIRAAARRRDVGARAVRWDELWLRSSPRSEA